MEPGGSVGLTPGGIFVLTLVFVGVVWVLSAGAEKRAREKYALLWPALAVFVNGTFDGAKMLGTHHGLLAESEVRCLGGESPTYCLVVSLCTSPHGSDWTATRQGTGFLHLGPAEYRLKSWDDRLLKELTMAGALDHVTRFPCKPAKPPEIKWLASQGRLEYVEQIDDRHALPDADTFAAILDLLDHLVAINERTNTRSASGW